MIINPINFVKEKKFVGIIPDKTRYLDLLTITDLGTRKSVHWDDHNDGSIQVVLPKSEFTRYNSSRSSSTSHTDLPSAFSEQRLIVVMQANKGTQCAVVKQVSFMTEPLAYDMTAVFNSRYFYSYMLVFT